MMDDFSPLPVRGVVDRVLQSYQTILALDPSEIDRVGVDIPIPALDYASLLELCHRAREHFQVIDTLIEIPTPTYIIGDLHGNIFDLIRILLLSRLPPVSRFLFLGDYVDRGQYSIEIVTLLFSLAIKYPDHVFLLRGNHEFSRVNSVYGFKEECETYYGETNLYNEFNNAFDWMPLVCTVGKQLFCVHGGISPQVTSVRQIKHLKRPLTVYDNSIACDLVWSDPSSDTKDYSRSTRGNGVAFGNTAIKEFLRLFHMKQIIRAHQCVQLGIEKFNDQLITVFSCSNYADASGNRCGLIFVKENCELQTFSLPPLEQIPRAQALFSGAAGVGGIVSKQAGSALSLEGISNSQQRGSILCLIQQPIAGQFSKRKIGLAGIQSTHLPRLIKPNSRPRAKSAEPDQGFCI